ncbi:MAG TPA: GH25 family lysozyme [Propionicimonas sp.]|nr:GH25 family lysozyme [Propionicimonas sp.]HQA76937.1 GH25 family lysozyme [Propionicimonas sp.]HQD96475.1 GH25 family lysozyme [Propionicimonas sp.]
MSAPSQPALKLLIAAATAVVVTVGLMPSNADARPVAPGPAAAPAALPLAEPLPGPVITVDLVDAVIGRYGTRTSATFKVEATGEKLRYQWQRLAPYAKKWKNVSGAKKAKYTAKATTWASGTSFRVVVTGTGGKVTSAPAKLTVLYPTKSPAKDAEAAFGLTGLRQGVDLSAYQWTPAAKIRMKKVDAWAGKDGFTILRNGSGSRPIKQQYTDACTNKARKTGTEPVTEDCAYAKLAKQAKSAGLSLGHYWFNGWIASTDSTTQQLFAGGYSATASAEQFVKWLKRDGRYTKSSTDPLVLDIEAGNAWTKAKDGEKIKQKLRAWNPSEAAEFLTAVKQLLTADGYQANLYVYMSANRTLQLGPTGYLWQDVAGIAKLWVASWGTNNGRIPDAQPEVGPWAEAGGWSIWQYTSNARFSGSGVGALDGDIAKADAWTPLAG